MASVLGVKEKVLIKDIFTVCFSFQWMEKKQDGVFVFRSGRAEEREARRFDDHNNKTMEALYAKIQADIQREDKGSARERNSLGTDWNTLEWQCLVLGFGS